MVYRLGGRSPWREFARKDFERGKGELEGGFRNGFGSESRDSCEGTAKGSSISSSICRSSVKRVALLKLLAKYGCVFLREGGNHTLFVNPATQMVSSIPRHSEIHEFLVKKICRDLGVPVK